MDETIRWNNVRLGRDVNPPIVFLHGFLGSAEDWVPVVESLADTFFCICLDLPGHGSTMCKVHPEAMSMEKTAAAITAQLDESGVEQCGLAGYSMGGRLALYLAMHYPDRFNRVVLESASPGLKSEEARAARRAIDQKRARRLELTGNDTMAFFSFLQRWYEQPIFATMLRQDEKMNRLLERRMKNNPAGLAASLRGIGVGSQPSLWDKLAEYEIPTLLIVGERDRKFRFIAEAMSDSCPNIAVEELEDCGHNVHFDNCEGYTTVLNSFFSPLLGNAHTA